MAFVCVHVCACVYVCKPVCTQTPTRGCGGRRSMPGVLLCGPPLSYTRQGLTEPASTKESACLLLSARITGLAMPICVFILFLCDVWEFKLRSSFLHSKNCYPLSHLSNLA